MLVGEQLWINDKIKAGGFAVPAGYASVSYASTSKAERTKDTPAAIHALSSNHRECLLPSGLS